MHGWILGDPLKFHRRKFWLSNISQMGETGDRSNFLDALRLQRGSELTDDCGVPTILALSMLI